MYALKIIAVALGAYLFGNINTALIISKIKKQDIRKMDSGNPGSMNMFRNYGVILGLVTLICDAVKGAVPCILGWWILGDEFSFSDDRFGLYLGGLCVIIGHIFPVFLKFKGGKGIASSIGVCLVADPIVTLIMFAVGVAFIIITKMGSVTSFIIISVPLAIEGFKTNAVGGYMGVVNALMIFALFSLTLFAHRKNVVKLFRGKESKTVLFGKNKSAKRNKNAAA
ncbi:MAG: glycerol-3-phosphate acyltransferase [Clostridia bacterium]|nr:glycerol-3-phosphate acyltransferase [Clostridia bacterium]